MKDTKINLKQSKIDSLVIKYSATNLDDNSHKLYKSKMAYEKIKIRQSRIIIATKRDTGIIKIIAKGR